MRAAKQQIVLDMSLVSAAKARSRVSGFTHEYYRYPARFSPLFVRSAIEQFTRPGDFVLDPFMGGGTTLVEAAACGRNAIGTDISTLSVFVSRVKTRVYSQTFVETLERWGETTARRLSVNRDVERPEEWIEAGYQRNLNTPRTWHVRKLIEQALDEVQRLSTGREQDFARCAILKTAQWALDCRETIPGAQEFREALSTHVSEMTDGARSFASSVRSNREANSRGPRIICLRRSANGVEKDKRITQHVRPKLILTSPPYPGVHVLYHRWQIHGRRETPAPFWIANKLDGAGAAYYTFGYRGQESLSNYFAHAKMAFSSLRKLARPDTTLVQLVAFSELEWQLPKYLETMEESGWREAVPERSNAKEDIRLWRDVPNRRWYASMRADSDAGKEVLLFHRPAKEG